MADRWAELFKWFHEHPEVSNQEDNTTEKILEVLREEGIPVLPSGLQTGVIALIQGGKEGPARMLRADIDALPVMEESGLPWASKCPGVMHACGHDFHITCVLRAAAELYRKRDRLAGKLYVVFQPGEEGSDGAPSVLRTHILDDAVEYYGLHADPEQDPGVVSLASGAVTASVDRFMITVCGTGGHGATPHLAENPIPILWNLLNEISLSAGRKLSAFTPHVITVTHISGGTTWNVIPAEAFAEGTVRTQDTEGRTAIQKHFTESCEAFGRIYGIPIELEYENGPNVTVNDEALVQKAYLVAEKCGMKAIPMHQYMIGDDFGDYYPPESGKTGIYIRTGSGKGAPLHHPQFQVDLSAIEPVSHYLAALLLYPDE